MKPVGPEEPQVYWRRRALVIGLVVLALIILFLIFRPKGGEETQAEPVTTPSPTVSASPSPTATVTGSPSPTASPSTSARPCVDTDIEVTVTPDKQEYAEGEDPQLAMAIVNTGTTACQRDVGAGANEIVVSSGGVQVWSSDDCSPSTQSVVQTLEPGGQANVTVTWPRVKSAQGCPSPQAAVPAGAYDAVGRNGKVTSQKAAFTLQ